MEKLPVPKIKLRIEGTDTFGKDGDSRVIEIVETGNLGESGEQLAEMFRSALLALGFAQHTVDDLFNVASDNMYDEDSETLQ